MKAGETKRERGGFAGVDLLFRPAGDSPEPVNQRAEKRSPEQREYRVQSTGRVQGSEKIREEKGFWRRS